MTDDAPRPIIKSYRWYEEEEPVTDDVVERVARAIARTRAVPYPDSASSLFAQAALAALRPHEQIGEGLWVTDANPWALEAQIAREAREDMRERCLLRLHQMATHSFGTDERALYALEQAMKAIRALKAEGE